MPRIRRMEIVGEGVQRNGATVTREMLDSVVRNYNPEVRPPITLGHPKKGDDQMAALGRVANLRTETNDKGKYVLVGEMHYTPELEELEDSLKFEGQSAGIHPLKNKPGEYHLHHLAQLGQLPPAGDVKTKDVIQLSDDDFGDDCIYLSAYVGNATEEENDTMDFKKLMAAIAGYSDDEKKQLAETLGIKAAPVVEPPDGDDDKKKKGSDDLESEAVKKLQNSMASDRKSVLKDLLNDGTREISDAQKEALGKQIDAASTVELCDDGEGGFFNNTKAFIKTYPAKSSSTTTKVGDDDEFAELFKRVELADEGKGDAAKPFSMEGF
ncbi:hypothetical protein HJ184_09250 [Vibrio parahaemolyticus]|nr:hypothetical protein [Vibrio parahaemolyticus]